MKTYFSIGYRDFQRLFPLGDVLISPSVAALGLDLKPLLRRYQRGDWGEECPEDRALNDHAVDNQEAILTDYAVVMAGKTIRIHIMTEADRTYTILFLANELPDAP